MVTARKQSMKPRRKQSEPESAWPDDDGVKINLYGRSGTGKTTLWATFPKPILAIIVSGGKKPGELRSIDTKEYRKTINPKILKGLEQWPGLVEEAGSGEYATTVLDHATGFQDLTLKEILGLEKLPEQLSWGLASQQQYGQLALQMKERLRTLLDLSCNVVIVAQEREFNTDNDAGGVVMPYVASALTPSVVGWLNPACDYICETFIRPRMEEKVVKIGGKTKRITRRGKGVEYCLRTAPHDVYTTKFRVPRGTPLPDVIVDPTFEKIQELIKRGG